MVQRALNAFKARLDKFWLHQEVMFDFTVDLIGTGNRSVLSLRPVAPTSLKLNRHLANGHLT